MNDIKNVSYDVINYDHCPLDYVLEEIFKLGKLNMLTIGTGECAYFTSKQLFNSDQLNFSYLLEDKEIVFIGTELPGEYAGSVYTKKLRGMNAKAKANAVQILPEMIEIASNGVFEHNRKAKHARDAKMGWYRYDTRFALPVYNDHGEVDRYNIFTGRLLIRHASSGKKYLYDVLEIKKETSKSCQA